MRVARDALGEVGDGVARALGDEAVARREQPLDADRAARVDAAGRDADLGAKAEAVAVGEARPVWSNAVRMTT